MSAPADYKVTHVSVDRVCTVQVVRGAAGAWQAIDWLEQRLGLGLRCSAINLSRLAVVTACAPTKKGVL